MMRYANRAAHYSCSYGLGQFQGSGNSAALLSNLMAQLNQESASVYSLLLTNSNYGCQQLQWNDFVKIGCPAEIESFDVMLR